MSAEWLELCPPKFSISTRLPGRMAAGGCTCAERQVTCPGHHRPAAQQPLPLLLPLLLLLPPVLLLVLQPGLATPTAPAWLPADYQPDQAKVKRHQRWTSFKIKAACKLLR